jgi:hypothetical protein
MLAALAAAALVVGTIGSAVSLSQEPSQTNDKASEAIVEVQAPERANPSRE